jgi:hypothetical protein
VTTVADLLHEALINTALMIAGYALLLIVRSARSVDADRRVTPAAAWVALGGASFVLVLAVTSLLHVNRPAVVLLPPVLALALALAVRRSGSVVIDLVRAVPAAALIASAAAVVARAFRLGSFTGDSFHLIANSRLFAQNRILLFALDAPSEFEGFPPGYSLLQMPSAWGGHTANLSLGLLIAGAIIIQVAHLLRTGPRPAPPLLTVAVVGTLMATHFFWVMTNYVNSHAVVALLLLVAYALLRDAEQPQHHSARSVGELAPLLVVLSALVLLRVENVLVLLLFLTLLSRTDDAASGRVSTLRAGLVAVGATAVLHQTVVIAVYVAAGSSPSVSSLGLLGVGVGALLTAAFAPWLIRARVLPADYAVLVLLAANAGYAILDRRAFARSVLATLENLFAWRGGWGILPIAVILLAGTAWLTTSSDDREGAEVRALLRFCLAAVLLLFFTGFLRDLPFRVGAGDSFNRQLFHLLPLVMVAIGRAIGRSGSLHQVQVEAAADRPAEQTDRAHERH